jgi:hypothetical protein
VARIGGYLLCLPPLLFTRRAPRYKCLPLMETSLDITNMGAIVAVTAHRCHQISPVLLMLDQTAAMSIAPRYTPATLLRQAISMTRSSQHGRCTEDLPPHAHQNDDTTESPHKTGPCGYSIWDWRHVDCETIVDESGASWAL